MRPRFASPSRDCARGWSGGRRQGCCVRHPLEADQWTHLARQGDRARPRLGAAPPSAPPTTGPSTVPGPRSGQLSLSAERIASRKRPFIEQDTIRISEVLDPGIRNAKKFFIKHRKGLPSSPRNGSAVVTRGARRNAASLEGSATGDSPRPSFETPRKSAAPQDDGGDLVRRAGKGRFSPVPPASP
jgi:hypothetical protein